MSKPPSPNIPLLFPGWLLAILCLCFSQSLLGQAITLSLRNGDRITGTIISEDAGNIEAFLNAVDAAAVYANASTAFTDGGQFGLGAEIGISTQKLHARGPMGLEELTSYKWLVRGTGQVRNS